MDTSINYELLAQAVILSAMEDAQGQDAEALMAKQWLDGVDFERFGLEELAENVGQEGAVAHAGCEKYGSK